MNVRFAPSPTGVFHIGNWRTAWISREWARVLGVPWAVRFEDIDTPRVIAGAQDRQLLEMRELGLNPDIVTVQSSRRARHWELFEKARKDRAIYPCRCSRKEILSALASAPHGEEILYSGKCREGFSGTAPTNATIAWRFLSDDAGGKHDFIVARTDASAAPESFVPAYHWACAIDDAEGDHGLLVRAHDLRSATPIQREIQKWMGLRDFPAVFHTALVTDDQGHRLEKRTRGVTLPELAQSGISAKRLIELFGKSFEARREDFAPGKIWGEPRTQLALKDLIYSAAE